MTSALALACMLIVGDCHGPHVADVTRAIDHACRSRECRSALVIVAHNEFRWHLSAGAVRFSPFGLTSPGLYDPARDTYDDAARTAWGILTHGRTHCGTWRASFAWFIRGAVNGRCPRVGPESRQRWREMRRLMRPSPTGATRLTEAQGAALQSFPADWTFSGTTSASRWKQIGNALPPPLAEALGRAIMRAIA